MQQDDGAALAGAMDGELDAVETLDAGGAMFGHGGNLARRAGRVQPQDRGGG